MVVMICFRPKIISIMRPFYHTTLPQLACIQMGPTRGLVFTSHTIYEKFLLAESTLNILKKGNFHLCIDHMFMW